jgi:hypothetical protein
MKSNRPELLNSTAKHAAPRKSAISPLQGQANRRNGQGRKVKSPAPKSDNSAAPPAKCAMVDLCQGTQVKLLDVEPWPTAVDGAEVLRAIADTMSSYVLLPDGAADAIALWCAHTHVFRVFEHSPRLNYSSPDMRCGKTLARDITSLFVSRPLSTENLTPAVLFRLVDAQYPTVLADEYDSWLKEREELRGLVNAGYKRGGGIMRCVGDGHEVRRFQVFAPVVLCGIGALPATLYDRSIVIRLKRARPDELSKRFDSRHTEPEQELCRKLARWCRDNESLLTNCDPTLPPGIFNRVADNWRPLFAIAQTAGGDWPERAAAALAKLNGAQDTEEQGVGVALLHDIRTVFADGRLDRLGSSRLCLQLGNLEGKTWISHGRRGEPITPTELARVLRPFGIAPRNTKFETGAVLKAYHQEDFQDAFSRYLPPMEGH